MATIRDIAREAAVSTATVSRWMNGTLAVRAETARRIEAAVKQHGYAPSHVARGLVTKSSRTIGLLLADISNPFFAGIARAVEDAAQAHGYAVIVCNSDSDPGKESAYIRLLRQKYIDGIVFLSNSHNRSGLRTAIEEHIPVVVADEEVDGLPQTGVFVDNQRGAFEAVSHLVALGHRRIAHIAGPRVHSTPLRLAGYRQALREAGVRFEKERVCYGDFQIASGNAAAHELLEVMPRPTAIFAGNDLMAIGALQAVWEKGLRVPDDLSIVGFDDVPLAAAVVPPLTTVAQPTAELGRTAVSMLIAKIEGRRFPKCVILPCTLRVRRSTGPVHSASGASRAGT